MGGRQRDNVRMITSDNGSNKVGESSKLTCTFQEMYHIKIGNFKKRMVVSG